MMEKNKGGHPALFKSVEDLDEKILDYFEYIKGEFHWETSTNEDGKPVDKKVWDRLPEQATITGLCLHLGFESRQSFYDYEKRSEFSYTIRRARLRVENVYEKKLTDRESATAGVIFGLKNLGWTDKQEIDHKNDGESFSAPTINIVKPG